MEDSSKKKVESNPWKSYHTVFTNAKAGMEGVDKEKVQKIVYEMSKGSKYFENQERKEAIMMTKIQTMRAQCFKLTPANVSYHQMMADKRIVELEATRDLSRIWLHVDMDAFYAAVETLADPSLKGKPMAVGGMSMISTANYEARKFGVRAAMPGFIARKLCPHLIFVPVDFKKYTYYSDLTRKVFHKYDPNFIAASLDEAYLDITEICKVRGVSGEEIAEEIRTSVSKETGLTCSAGVAPNRLLAKVCSDINKPNGQFVLPNDRMAVMTFISSLPIRKIGGIGKVTEHILKDVFGINTCEELLQKSGHLFAFFSRSSAEFFLSVGLGLGQTDAPQANLRKGISSERTFSATGDKTFLHKKLEELAEMLSTDMGKEGLSGRTLTLKLKTSSFEVRTRAVTLHKHICSSEDILNHASKLLKAEFPISLRLIGLRMSQFNEGKTPSDPTQRTLTNYIVSKSDSERNMGDCSSLGLDVSDHQLMIDDEANLSADCYERSYYNSEDLLDSDLRSGPDDSNGTLSDSIGETKSEGNGIDRLVKINNNVSDACISWLDGYKCSVCRFELPPSFTEERQEHSDFHLAERLQQESCSSSRTPNITQRSIRKDGNESEGKKKKQKTSAKGVNHIPIDCFFVKSNQNF